VLFFSFVSKLRAFSNSHIRSSDLVSYQTAVAELDAIIASSNGQKKRVLKKAASQLDSALSNKARRLIMSFRLFVVQGSSIN